MRGRIHHLDLTVSDVEKARPFYDLFLSHMGYAVSYRNPDGSTEWVHEDDGVSSVGIYPAKGANAGRKHDRYSPGLHHAAFISTTREDVDALHSKLESFGAHILDAPADYPQYNKGLGYYAVFFADPDGLKLEYVWTPPPKP